MHHIIRANNSLRARVFLSLIGRDARFRSDGEDWREGVVLLRAARPQGRQRRAAEPHDGARVLEGHGVGQGHPELRRRQAGDRAQEDARLLPGARPARHQDGLGHERVPPPRPLRRRPRRSAAASQGNPTIVRSVAFLHMICPPS
uniref:Uncharacterized protein n=1 Tax=Zea mays TaxID=4577 RepID=C4J127_MAIZE|nr:unknown [Zea mays]